MSNRNGKPPRSGKQIPPQDLRELRTAFRACEQAQALFVAATERWERLLTEQAKKLRVPRNKVVCNLQTGEMARRG